jgi:hypothetical protein
MRVLSKCALLLVALTAFSSSDRATTGPARSPAELAFAVMAPAYISTLSIEVTGPGIDSTLTFNVMVTNGVGTGTLRVPAGAGRRIVGRAFAAVGVITQRAPRKRFGSAAAAPRRPEMAATWTEDLTQDLPPTIELMPPAPTVPAPTSAPQPTSRSRTARSRTTA